MKGKVQEELRKEIEGDEYVILMFGEDTEAWQESKLNSEEKKEELSHRIGLSVVFEELGELLNNFVGDKLWQANRELVRKESVGESITYYSRRRKSNDFGTAISGDLGNSGDQSSLL